MGYTVLNWAVDHLAPSRILTSARYDRLAQITNQGLAPVWLGHADLQPGGIGVEIQPGDPPYWYNASDELYAVSWSATVLTVMEFLSGPPDDS